jgi:hypothetical protein
MSTHEHDVRGQASSQRDDLLRIKLTSDIEKFERQLADLKTNGSYANFADILTLKELIRSRQEMLRRIK